MPAAPADDIFRRNRKRAAKGIRPEGRRANENTDTDARDVRAGEVRPFPQYKSREHQVENHAGGNRKYGARKAFEQSELGLPGYQNQGYQEGRKVPVLNAEKATDRGWPLLRTACGSRYARFSCANHSGSATL